MHSLPIFVRLAGRPVILVGAGEAAESKRRLLERAGAVVVGEDGSRLPPPQPFAPSEVEARATSGSPATGPSTSLGTNGINASLAIVVDDDLAVARLKARGVLVNAVDRPALCDFTLPAIVDRDPVIVAIGTGGASAGLAAALRQRLEAILPAGLGRLAEGLYAAREAWRARYPDAGERRRALSEALAEGGALDPLRRAGLVPASTMPRAISPAEKWPPEQVRGDELVAIVITSPDPDDLTLRQARLLANADRVTHGPDVPPAILSRARADATRHETAAPPPDAAPGLHVDVRMA